MALLSELKPKFGSRHSRKRIGFGMGSGMGETSTRGQKGQRGRSGQGKQVGFEGGQTPLLRRIPKRGFNNARFTVDYIAVNVGDLNKFDDGARVDEAALRAVGLANGRGDGVKILGDGELTKKLTVSAHAFSASARTKIEAKGGACEVVGSKPAAPVETAAPAPKPAKPAKPAKPTKG